jgi:hypothetical protein
MMDKSNNGAEMTTKKDQKKAKKAAQEKPKPVKMFPLFGKHSTGSLVIYASAEDFERCGITRFGSSECSMLWKDMEPAVVWENAVYELFFSPAAQAEKAGCQVIEQERPKVIPIDIAPAELVQTALF